MEKRLYRDELNKKIAGVCAGLAEYLNVDVTIVRVIFALALVLKGSGALVYLVLWVVLPKKPYYINNPTVDYTVPPQSQPYNPFANNASVPPFAMPQKKRSNGGLYAGIAMVLFGSLFLIKEFDIFPFINFQQVWPVVFIILGVVVIFGGSAKTPAPAEKEKWEEAEKKDDAATPKVPADKPENE